VKHKKPGIFTDFGTGMVSKILSYFGKMEPKMLFLQGAEFFTQWPKFWANLARKS
jgi:hypothetical protein